MDDRVVVDAAGALPLDEPEPAVQKDDQRGWLGRVWVANVMSAT